MKINWKKHLITVSFLGLLLSVFGLQTVSLGCILAYTSWVWMKQKITLYIERGLINLLPESLKEQLVRRSLFDFLCDIWFTERTSILKIVFKPFFTNVQPDNAVQVLNDLPDSVRKKLLTKGVIKIFSERWRTILAPNLKYEEHSDESLEVVMPMREIHLERSPIVTDDTHSTKREKPKHIRNSSLIFRRKFKDEQQQYQNDQSSSSKQSPKIVINHTHKWDRLEAYKAIKKQFQQQGIIPTLKSTIQTIRNIVELNNIPTKLRNINSITILKLMIVFWSLVIVQVKLSPHARKFIFKFLYIMAILTSVIGATATTAVLMYKEWKPKQITNKSDQQPLILQ